MVLAAWTTPEVRAGGHAEPHGHEVVAWARRGALISADIAADRARADHPNLAVETRVFEPGAAAALADASADAGLVVVGARDCSNVAVLFLGSVGHVIIHGSCCPVPGARRPAPGRTVTVQVVKGRGAGQEDTGAGTSRPRRWRISMSTSIRQDQPRTIKGARHPL